MSKLYKMVNGFDSISGAAFGGGGGGGGAILLRLFCIHNIPTHMSRYPNLALLHSRPPAKHSRQPMDSK